MTRRNDGQAQGSLRGALGKAWRSRVPRRTRYRLWALYSRARFGQHRTIRIYGNRRITVCSNDYRAFRVAEIGGSQAHKVDVWARLVASNPELCLDVGANYGEFTAAVVEARINTLMVEANPYLTPCLRKTFERAPEVHVVEAAAADYDGIAEIFVNPHATGSGSRDARVPEGERQALGSLGTVRARSVRAVRLDTLVPELFGRLPRSVALKVDVEGFEGAVLAGANVLLANAVWWRALVEFNPAAVALAGGSPEELWSALRSWPGRILSSVDGKPDLALGALPVQHPATDCDVLIGVGQPGAIR